MDNMQASELSPASKGVGCAVSPGHGNYTAAMTVCRYIVHDEKTETDVQVGNIAVAHSSYRQL